MRRPRSCSRRWWPRATPSSQATWLQGTFGRAYINDKGGQMVRPSVEDFGTAIGLIAQGKPIDYEGAYDSNDWDAVGDMYPPLVHWKVENQQFVEYELYRCSPQQPLCPVK